MRFVVVKSEQAQANALVFRGRDLLVRQRTQLINAVRSHMAEFGWIASKGTAHVEGLSEIIAAPASLLEAARPVIQLLLETLDHLDTKIAMLDREITRRAREDEAAARLMTVPGIGPITATALIALAPPPESFARGRDFAGWLGLTPLQRSTGG